jgi:hypothetical protein
LAICIYCGRELSVDCFDKEHVIPRQLGHFKNGQTLINAVCKDCNHYFSVTLERALGRDSLEATLRVRHGQKRADGFSGQRLKFRIPSGMPGAGIVVVPARSPDRTTIVLTLPPQVGVQLSSESEYRYYTEDELKQRPNLLPSPEAKVKLQLLVSKEDSAALERLRNLVRSRLPRFREEGDLSLPPPALVHGQI